MDLKQKILILCGILGLVLVGWKMSSKNSSEIKSPMRFQGKDSDLNRSSVENAESSESKKPVFVRSGKKPTEVEPQDSPKNPHFVEILKDLGQCLEIKSTVDGNFSKPNLVDLIQSVKNELGAPRVQVQDWSNTHIVLPSGQQRRIHIETEDLGQGRIGKRLKFYGVDSEDLPVEIPVRQEMAFDPKDSDVLSLESQGQITLREKSGKVYFTNGEELIYIEKNDLLSDLEMKRKDRVFKCTDLDREKPSCGCL